MISILKKNVHRILIIFLGGLLLDSRSATITKADNASFLSAGSSWVGGVVPGSSDTILIDNTVTTTQGPNIGSGVSVQGLQFTNPGGIFTIAATGTTALGLGTGGINMSSATQRLQISSYISLTANQSWNIGSSGTVILATSQNGLSLGANTLNITGAGTLDLRRSETFSNNATIGVATVSVSNPTGTVTFAGNNTYNVLNIASGRVSGATIGNYGAASNFGSGGTNSTIFVGGSGSNGVLEYTGSTGSTNRTLTRNGGSSSSGIDVTTAGQTLSVSGNLSSGNSVNSGTNGWVFGGAGNLTLTGVINNSTAVGSTGTTLTKNGVGTLTLSGNNTFSGNVTVNGGTVIASSTNSLGTGSVIVNDGATLTLQSNTIFNDSSYLYLNGSTSFVNMDFTGVDLLSNIFLNGVGITSQGIYTSSQLNSIFGGTYFGGTGSFNVSAIPEPSTYMALMGCFIIMIFFLRKRFMFIRQNN